VALDTLDGEIEEQVVNVDRLIRVAIVHENAVGWLPGGDNY
jgi:hypothetical protein